MNIRFSRHAQRRMTLYGIDEHDVLVAITNGDKQILPNGKLCFLFRIDDKLKYPLKVVAIKKLDSLRPILSRRRDEI